MRRLGLLLTPLLITSIACSHTTKLSYSVAKRPQAITQPDAPVPPEPVKPLAQKSERVVLDMSASCKEPKDALRSRCRRMEDLLTQAIADTGREVIVSNDSAESALELARDRGASLVLAVGLPAQRLTPSTRAPVPLLKTPRSERVDRADLLCQTELRAALMNQKTHFTAPLRVHVKDSETSAIVWRYEDAVQADLGVQARTVQASVAPTESTSDDDDDDDRDVWIAGHHHDHHCHHHDHEDDDDEGAKLLAAVVLTVLVVGVVVLAAQAAQKGPPHCTLADVPEPSFQAKWQLSEELDRLLTTRLAQALFSAPKTTETPATGE